MADVELMEEGRLTLGLHSYLEKQLDLGTLQVGGPEWSDREPSGDTCTRADIKHLAARITSATVVELTAVHVHTWAWPGSSKTWCTKTAAGPGLGCGMPNTVWGQT